MAAHRPVAFIGSSAEGLPLAKAIQVNLEHACETIIWSQGIFGLSDGTLEALVSRLDDFDFAILVLTADDVSISREVKAPAPRDNVLLELGMFIGAIGRERTFAVVDRSSKMKLPSDLAGITLAEFEPPSKGNAQSAVGAASTKIEAAIGKLGIRPAAKVDANIEPSTEFQIIHDLLDQSVEQFFVLMDEQDVTLQQNRHGFGGGIWFQYHNSQTMCSGSGRFSVNDVCRKLADAGILKTNLRDEVTLTERGKKYVAWLRERGHQADFFNSAVGGWGDRPGDMPDLPEEFKQGVPGRAVKVDPNKSAMPDFLK
jgi:hypothetical protein